MLQEETHVILTLVLGNFEARTARAQVPVRLDSRLCAPATGIRRRRRRERCSLLACLDTVQRVLCEVWAMQPQRGQSVQGNDDENNV